MTLALKVPPQQAQQAKEFLMRQNYFDRSHQPSHKQGFIYFPITKKIPPALLKKNCPEGKVEEIILEKSTKQLTIQELLKGKLTPTELGLLPSSSDMIGSILVLEMPDELISKEKIIAQAYLQALPSIK